MEPTTEAGELVYSYGLQLEPGPSPSAPDNDLRQLILEDGRQLHSRNADNAPWRKYYEPWEPGADGDPNTKMLRDEAVLLSHAWKLFRQNIPKAEQADFEGRPPSVDGLVNMVDSIARDWQNKRNTTKSGRFMKYFIGFCETLDSHSTMLEMLPSGSEYVSLFTGALKSIIKASSNYEKIASGLADALSAISVHVVACEKELVVYKTEAMQRLVGNFYAHLFLFLEDTIEWYLKKQRLRILDAFRENFFTHFEKEILNIKDLSYQIRRQAQLSTMGEIRSVRQTVEGVEDMIGSIIGGQIDVRIALDGISREQANIKYNSEKMLLLQEQEREDARRLHLESAQRMEDMKSSLISSITTGVIEHLTGMAQNFLDSKRRDIDTPRARRYIQTQQNAAVFEVQSYERDNIIFDSKGLTDFFDGRRVQIPNESTTPTFLENVAASHLSSWTTATDSRLLSIAGQRGSGLELDPMTIVAIMCVDFANKSKLPVISYFCQLSRDERLRPGNTRESQELVALTYSLMRQLIEQLPAKLECESDFSGERFSRLDGTLKTWSDAIAVLNDLLRFTPKILYCIIDGFQWLDDPSTDKFLKELVKVLRGAAVPSSNCFKVLITTTGRSRSLLGELSQTELILADRDGAKGGAARRGGNIRFTI